MAYITAAQAEYYYVVDSMQYSSSCIAWLIYWCIEAHAVQTHAHWCVCVPASTNKYATANKTWSMQYIAKGGELNVTSLPELPSELQLLQQQLKHDDFIDINKYSERSMQVY